MDAEQRFGILVRNAMDARGVKGYQLAAAMNKQPSYVSRIINGEYKGTPPAVEMIVIEEVLGLPIWKQLQALEYPVAAISSSVVLLFNARQEDSAPGQRNSLVNDQGHLWLRHVAQPAGTRELLVDLSRASLMSVSVRRG